MLRLDIGIILMIRAISSLGQIQMGTSTQLSLCQRETPVTSRNVIIGLTGNGRAHPTLHTFHQGPGSSLTLLKRQRMRREENATSVVDFIFFPKKSQEEKDTPNYGDFATGATSFLKLETEADLRPMSTKKSHHLLSSLPENSQSARSRSVTKRDEGSSLGTDCKCLVVATEPLSSYMTVDVRFSHQDIPSFGEDKTGAYAEQTNSDSPPVIACPKLYLVFDGKTRQELRCVSLGKDQIEIYQLPKLRLKTLAIHLLHIDLQSNAGIVVNITSIGDGVLQTSCNLNSQQEHTTSPPLPDNGISGPTASTHRHWSTPKDNVTTTGHWAVTGFRGNNQVVVNEKRTTYGYKEKDWPSTENTSALSQTFDRKPISQVPGEIRQPAGKHGDDDGDDDDDEDSPKAILISILTIGVLLVIGAGLFLYLRRWWRKNTSGKSKDRPRGPVPYCVTLITDVLKRNTPSSSLPEHIWPSQYSSGKISVKERKNSDDASTEFSTQDDERKSKQDGRSNALPFSDYTKPIPKARERGERGKKRHENSSDPITTVVEIHRPPQNEKKKKTLSYISTETGFMETSARRALREQNIIKPETRTKRGKSEMKNSPTAEPSGLRDFNRHLTVARAFLARMTVSRKSRREMKLEKLKNHEPEKVAGIEDTSGEEYSDSYETYVPEKKDPYHKLTSIHFPAPAVRLGHERESNSHYETSNYEVAKICFQNDEETEVKKISSTSLPGYSTIDKELRTSKTAAAIENGSINVLEIIPEQNVTPFREGSSKQPKLESGTEKHQSTKIHLEGPMDLTGDSKLKSRNRHSSHDPVDYKNILLNSNTPNLSKKTFTTISPKYILGLREAKPTSDTSRKSGMKLAMDEAKDCTNKSKILVTGEINSPSRRDADMDETIIKVLTGNTMESIRLSPYLNPKPLSATPLYGPADFHKYDYPDVLIPNIYRPAQGENATLEFSVRSKSSSSSNSSLSFSDSETSEDEHYANEVDHHVSRSFRDMRAARNNFLRNDELVFGDTKAGDSNDVIHRSYVVPKPKPRLVSRTSSQGNNTDLSEILFSEDECSRESVDV